MDYRLLCLVLATLLVTCSGQEADEEHFKCLQCDRSDATMCFSNATCPADKRFCYHYKWLDTSGELLNEREWGCTSSRELCERRCEIEQCSMSRCCYADINFSNSSNNFTLYQRCVGVAGAESIALSWVLVMGLGTVLAAWI